MGQGGGGALDLYSVWECFLHHRSRWWSGGGSLDLQSVWECFLHQRRSGGSVMVQGFDVGPGCVVDLDLHSVG
ncbi:hypothetical protein CEXT_519131 [Caerostris extrusa]|uniref:Uncharacterized protein n=1 Tax=Caerostris extrusa TaxID=172846 RepID=A0AAV4RKI2_CAEEX|nr:hypothetical protein CEXT_519131 [Caerostris extrusa]